MYMRQSKGKNKKEDKQRCICRQRAKNKERYLLMSFLSVSQGQKLDLQKNRCRTVSSLLFIFHEQFIIFLIFLKNRTKIWKRKHAVQCLPICTEEFHWYFRILFKWYLLFLREKVIVTGLEPATSRPVIQRSTIDLHDPSVPQPPFQIFIRLISKNAFIQVIFNLNQAYKNMGNTEFPSQFTEKQIQKLYARFQEIDKDKSGDLDPDEIFNVAQLNQNPLVKRVISVFDVNTDGKISFKEFLQGIAALYGTDDEKKLKFAFDIYDIDKDGYISNGELFTVLKMMVGNNLTDLQLQQLVDRTIIKADSDYDGKISYEQFKEMVKHLDIGAKLKISKI